MAHGSDSSRVGGVWEYAPLGIRWKIILFNPGMVGKGQYPSSLEFEEIDGKYRSSWATKRQHENFGGHS
jgi:hypothetical protein